MIKNTLPETRKTLADYERAVKLGIGHLKDAFRCHELAEEAFKVIGEHVYPSQFKYRSMNLEEAIDHVNRAAWRKLMSVTGLSNTFDAEAMSEFDKGLEQKPVIEFTSKNVMATIQKLSSEQGVMFSRGLVTLFKSLSGNYKSNSAFKVKRRSVVSRVLCTRWGGLRNEASHTCNDLERVLCGLTGREFKPYTMWGEWLEQNNIGEDYEDDFILVKFFQNGNGHLYIKDDKLLNRINDVIADWYGDRTIGN